MAEPVKVNVVSYGGVKPGRMIVGNGADGAKTTLLDAATVTDGSYMFYRRAGLTSWTVALPSLTNGTSMFYSCSALTSFAAALSSLTNGTYMFNFCTGLTSFAGDLSSLTNGDGMFANCTVLTSWTVALPSLTNGTSMFQGCPVLTSFDVDLPNLENGSQMFAYSTGLTSFAGDLSSLTNGDGMFQGCNLDAPSVLKILTSIPDRAAAGLAVASLHIGKKTNYEDNADVAAMLGTTTPIAAGTHSCKGWTITVQS